MNDLVQILTGPFAKLIEQGAVIAVLLLTLIVMSVMYWYERRERFLVQEKLERQLRVDHRAEQQEKFLELYKVMLKTMSEMEASFQASVSNLSQAVSLLKERIESVHKIVTKTKNTSTRKGKK